MITAISLCVGSTDGSHAQTPSDDPVLRNHAAVRRLCQFVMEADLTVEPEPEVRAQGAHPGHVRIKYWRVADQERTEQSIGDVTSVGVRIGNESRIITRNPGRNKDGTDFYSCAIARTLTECGAYHIFYKSYLYHGRDEETVHELRSRGAVVAVEPGAGPDTWIRFEDDRGTTQVRARLAAKWNYLLDRMESYHTASDGGGTKLLVEVRSFKEVEPGVYFPGETVACGYEKDGNLSTVRLLIRSAKPTTEIPDAGRLPKFPPNVSVHNKIRKTFVMTDVNGQLTNQEYDAGPPPTHLIGQAGPPYPAPSTGGDSTRPGWWGYAVAAGLLGMVGVAVWRYRARRRL